MAAISSINGKADALLTDKVKKTTRQATDKNAPTQLLDPSQLSQMREIKPSKSELSPRPTHDNTASYEETLAVAEKLQSRIRELSPDPHSVSIRTDEESSRYVIEIQDPDGKVVKQFPSEKVLNLHQKLDDLSGMVIDEMI